ncbi:MAG: DedA family protein [Acidobacteria bacterium]|nr:DedA family protein [Acidobacteriota bacterium]
MAAAVRWTLLTLLALALILVPFVIWEEPITAWVEALLADDSSRGGLGLALAGLLAVDVLLPIPSSLVSTAAGYLLGVAGGTLATGVGMTVGAVVGYGLGAKPARRFTRRFVGEAELLRAQSAFQRWGGWALVACRAVPVLAEASVVFAGVAGMDFRRFLLLTTLANFAIGFVYAGVGALALEANSFLLAFAAAVVVPGLAMLLFRRLRA